MIRHIVLFNLRPDIEPSDQEWLLTQMRNLAKLPVVRQLAVGKLLDAREPWYKERIATGFGWSMTMEFENEDALYVYQTSPEHLAVAPEIRKRVNAFKVFDFIS